MTPRPVTRIGCVSFLNARPLIDGLDGHEAMAIRYDVPSALLDDLLAGAVDIALCPVIDYQLSPAPLTIVPVGGIGCDGETLTVRLFSRVPLEDIDRVHVDTDSHTSIVLMQVVLADRFGVRPEVVRRTGEADEAQALLLIGDKVVTDAPADEAYPHQLDLGEAWKRATGLPFVFAVWMARRDEPLGAAPALLERAQRENASRIDAIVEAWAPRRGWPSELARRYLGELLKYRVGRRELMAMERFFERAAALGLIDAARPLALYDEDAVGAAVDGHPAA